jgi:hypothetical protein
MSDFVLLKRRMKNLIFLEDAMRKVLLVLLMASMAAGLLFLGCPTESTGSSGDERIAGDWFDIAQFNLSATDPYNWPNGTSITGSLPDVTAYWTAAKESWYIPDPFRKFDGTRLAAGGGQAAWTSRRAEIKKIIETYMLGELPPAYSGGVRTWTTNGFTTYALNTANPNALAEGDFIETVVPDGLSISYANSTSTAIGITGPVQLNAQVLIPQNTDPTNEKTYVNPATKNITYPVPALIYMGNRLDYPWARRMLDAGYAVVSLLTASVYSELPNPYNGVVSDLFNYTESQYQNDPTKPTEQVAVAWAVGQIIDALTSGPGVAFPTSPGGSTGKIDVTKLGVTGMSRWGKIALVVGAYEERIAVTIPEHAGGLGVSIERWSATTVQKGSFFLNVSNDATSVANLNNHPEGRIISAQLKDGNVYEPDNYVGRYRFGLDNPRQGSGTATSWYSNNFQGWDQAYQEQPGWTNANFKKFPASTVWTQDRDTGNQTGSHILSAPFDMHFLTALVAPRGLLIYAGTKDFWNNPSGEYAGYRLTDEVYKYLEIPQKLGVRILNIQHTAVEQRAIDQIEFMNHYFAGTTPPASKFKADPYPLDPRDYKDNVKFNWVYPGSTAKTFAQQTIDAFASGTYASQTGGLTGE